MLGVRAGHHSEDVKGESAIMGGKKKIGLIGGGQIGGNLALLAMQKNLGDVVLYDIPQTEGMPKGKALDMMQAGGIDDYDCRITGTDRKSVV